MQREEVEADGAARLVPGPAVIGLDIGGSFVKAMLSDADGHVRFRSRRPTLASTTAEDVLLRVARQTRELCERAEQAGVVPAAAGVVVPGVVDEEAGMVRFAGNLHWRDVPIRALLEEHLGLPVALGHDARAAGMAEAALGVAREVGDFLFVALGTGVAGAVSLRGSVWSGHHHLAGEFGHAVVDLGGEPCACGGRGCLETIAGAAAIVRRYQRKSGRSGVDAREVLHRREQDDPVAQQVVEEAVRALAVSLSGIQSTLDLELIVLGGGLASAALLAEVREAVRGRLTFQRMPAMALTALGNEAGCLGAALLARRAGTPSA